MTVLNLIVGPNHMLAEYGSMTFQTASQDEEVAGAERKTLPKKADDIGQGVEDTDFKEQGQNTKGQETNDFAHQCNICEKKFYT